MDKEISKHEVDEEQSQLVPGNTTQNASPTLQDEHLQAKYRQAYLEQIRRQSCPGCGESGIFE